MAKRGTAAGKGNKSAKAYDHKGQPAVLRPDIGLQAQFKKKKEPTAYRYDRSLDPQLSWDINADREHAEALIEKIRKATSVEQARAAAEELKRMSAPFLNWAGKAERHTFTVPTLPLFVHERLSTEAILKSVQTHKQQLDLFADPKLCPWPHRRLPSRVHYRVHYRVQDRHRALLSSLRSSQGQCCGFDVNDRVFAKCLNFSHSNC
jgi:adenine-specific DNA-methyltransferase